LITFQIRSDILASRNLSVPSLLGVALPVENLAKVNNSGVEVTLSHRNRITNNLGYSIGGNLTYARNEIVFIDETSVNPNIRRTGLPLNTQFGYRALGLFQTQAEVDLARSNWVIQHLEMFVTKTSTKMEKSMIWIVLLSENRIHQKSFLVSMEVSNTKTLTLHSCSKCY
jgi:hypothetical protein